MGFVEAKGWGHEVWYHECDFWVHFDDDFKDVSDRHVSSMLDRKGIFAQFLNQFERSIREQQRPY
jgi:hypothetical protein